MNKCMVVVAVLTVGAAPAHADAMLTSGSTSQFPTRVDLDVSVRAQVESTTIVLELPPIATPGTYVLTVPPPDGASPIGVDVDRGAGYVPVPVIVGEPPAGSGGSTDAAVQAWQGTAPLAATLQNLEPGTLTVRVRFVRVLRRVAGEVAFEVGAHRCPARAVDDPGAPTSVHLHLETARELTRLEATGGFVEQSLRGGEIQTAARGADAVVGVTYAEDSTGISTQLVTHRTPTADPMGGDAGYFMLLLDADPVPSTTPRAISLVIDRSGSMAGDKISQARDAARAMLDYLRPNDAFTIHVFDDGVDSFRGQPVPATPDNISAAREFIKEIDDGGSTDLDSGLQTALSAPSTAGRYDAVVMLSDGLATSGETDDRQILANAWRESGDTRIFTFSVGGDADFSLMEALARGSRGRHVDLNNAQATRDLVIRARELFQDIRDVRLTNLGLSIDGLGLADTLPEAPPDLFSGGQVVIVGRYGTPGAGAIRITGVEGELPFDQTFNVDAPALAEDADIIKYVWATEKVRSLMAKIADGGDASALRAEIEAIGVAYRIQTPFTHYSADYGSSGSDSASCAVGRAGGMVWLVVAIFVITRKRRQARSVAASGS